ncbi:uncharacterized protein BJ171DRAFT_180271 [Polychytrium aggregatum]|uniref:uncharacterized protein n=1 Tax=Polychytrium aggregatum TaxID=110093 RepID=UPI0022FE8269|nr:uncharacterized protein BJ171DRAFT_180271 [Polychytrium aggregatum]KAI9202434.1 hypothetical protein BJ171DRAFT_180271 [Polychytrium aggregatum]
MAPFGPVWPRFGPVPLCAAPCFGCIPIDFFLCFARPTGHLPHPPINTIAPPPCCLNPLLLPTLPDPDSLGPPMQPATVSDYTSSYLLQQDDAVLPAYVPAHIPSAAPLLSRFNAQLERYMYQLSYYRLYQSNRPMTHSVNIRAMVIRLLAVHPGVHLIHPFDNLPTFKRLYESPSRSTLDGCFVTRCDHKSAQAARIRNRSLNRTPTPKRMHPLAFALPIENQTCNNDSADDDSEMTIVSPTLPSRPASPEPALSTTCSPASVYSSESCSSEPMSSPEYFASFESDCSPESSAPSSPSSIDSCESAVDALVPAEPAMLLSASIDPATFLIAPDSPLAADSLPAFSHSSDSTATRIEPLPPIGRLDCPDRPPTPPPPAPSCPIDTSRLIAEAMTALNLTIDQTGWRSDLSLRGPGTAASPKKDKKPASTPSLSSVVERKFKCISSYLKSRTDPIAVLST